MRGRRRREQHATGEIAITVQPDGASRPSAAQSWRGPGHTGAKPPVCPESRTLTRPHQEATRSRWVRPGGRGRVVSDPPSVHTFVAAAKIAVAVGVTALRAGSAALALDSGLSPAAGLMPADTVLGSCVRVPFASERCVRAGIGISRSPISAERSTELRESFLQVVRVHDWHECDPRAEACERRLGDHGDV